ncbi:beta strand repeat-containing protein [Pseudoprimorskyibacter insulae]|uniref:Bifunctional hemolysin/adenylate cyclase n=1 Tax=Pseudoprimorskyibacter insulae TaxID=1695997 RepID=A0A2R8AX87_9RHOB|nr:calcium-binding protein [Pseudoprimorskyibacter insulae]SPF80633.1 Bifunctional hemolysin/adenylate cyclase [Pseudoprimorskyibacter insulae]
MANFFVTDVYSNTSDNVLHGTADFDRLTYTYTRPEGGVELTITDNGNTYSGLFDGYYTFNAYFTSIEAFTVNVQSDTSSRLTTGAGDDIFNLAGGNDTVYSGTGSDQINGGAGRDFWGADLSEFSANTLIDLNAVSNYGTGGVVQNVEGVNLTMGAGNDTVVGHALMETNYGDTIRGGAGDDLIKLDLGGWDAVEGGTGDDRLHVTNNLAEPTMSIDSLTLGADGYSGFIDGNYINNIDFSGIEHFTVIDNAGGNDNLNTGNGNDSLFGGMGNDTMRSAQGYDTIDGGEGRDFWQGDTSFSDTAVAIDLNGPSTYLGQGSVQNVEGFDVTTAGGNDSLTGCVSGETNYGDTVHSGGGDDLITLWLGGWDSVDGGAGSDRLVVTNQVSPGTGLSLTNTRTPEGTFGYTGFIDGYYINNIDFSGIEHFTFTDLNNGNDHFVAGSGNDSLTGGGGNDTLNSGAGQDTVNGGDGNDAWVADLSAVTTPLSIDLNGTSTLPGGGTLTNMEGMNLLSGSGNDTLRGHDSVYMNDTVNGGAGDDIIQLALHRWDLVVGGTGNDRLIVTNDVSDGAVVMSSFRATDDGTGYSGFIDGYYTNNIDFSGINDFTFIDTAGTSDNFTSGAGADLLIGGGGNDTLNSGSGNDTVDGGEGRDYWMADHSGLTTAVVVDLNGPSTLPGGGALTNVEGMNLKTGSGNDAITGLALRESNYGDIIDTGAGDDVVTLSLAAWDGVWMGPGDDRLIVTTDLVASPHVNVSAFSEDENGEGYSGFIDGYYTNNIDFHGVNHFTFIDNAGGNDRFVSGMGNDSLSGGAGNDTLISGGGLDTIDGGTGVDYWTADISANDTAVLINLNQTSTYHGGGSVKNIEGANLTTGAGNDTIVSNTDIATSQGDVFTTGAGDDRIEMVLASWDAVHGGAGIDTLKVTNTRTDSGGAYMTATAGTDGFSGQFDGYYVNNLDFTGIDIFDYDDQSNGTDNITAGSGNDTLRGGGGNDSLAGAAGNDLLDGGADNDYLDGGTGNDVIAGGAGTDRLRIHDDQANVTLGGDQGTFTISSADGMDTVSGVETIVFNDKTVAVADLLPPAGQIINGTVDDDTLTGDSGNDTIYGMTGNDSLSGLGGNDFLNGGEGNDTLLGGDGNDGFAPSLGNDLVIGGDGTDQVILHDAALADTTVTVNGAQLILSGPEGTDTFEGVEEFIFRDGLFTEAQLRASANLNLVGTEGNDTLTGGGGNDTISGLGGNDRLSGEDGNDSILGGDGLDLLIGGAGNDTLLGGATSDDLRDVVYGGDGNDSIDGGYGNDELRGDAGDDSIEGGFGVDLVIGGDGNDVLTGSAWSDQIFGGNGNDFINGGFGFDRVNGGTGADKFYHTNAAGHGSDWIQDYNAAEGDVLFFGGGVAVKSDFLVQRASTPNAGDAAVQEVFVTHLPSGNLLWALVDGDAQTSLNVLAAGQTFDLLG